MSANNRFVRQLISALLWFISLGLLSGCGGVTAKAPAGAGSSQQPISITLSPGSMDVVVDSSHELIASVANDSSNGGVNWTVSGSGCAGAACGTISTTTSANGAPVVYHAPAAVPNPATVTITATSAADTSKSASVTVTIISASALSVSVTPNSAVVSVKRTQPFTATVRNDPRNEGVTWSVSGSECTGQACGTISPTTSASGAAVTYTAPASVPNPHTITVTATSVANSSKSASVTVTVTSASAIAVSIAPVSAVVPIKGTQQFTATVSNDGSNSGVTWRVGNASRCPLGPAQCGTISPSSSKSGVPVTYTAPSTATTVPIPITATSVADPTKFATALITISGGATITVSVTPTNATVPPDGIVEFTATVQNDSANKGVAWSVSGSGCAGTGCGIVSPTTSASGTAVTYRAPATAPIPATVIVTATSLADGSKSASATVMITTPPSPGTVTISPASATVPVGGTQQFTATVAGDPSNSGVTWKLAPFCLVELGCGTFGTLSSPTPFTVTYRAPSVAGSTTLIATSVADPTKQAFATIRVVTVTATSTDFPKPAPAMAFIFAAASAPEWLHTTVSPSLRCALTGELQDWLGFEISPTVIWDYVTIDSLCKHLAGVVAAANRTGELT